MCAVGMDRQMGGRADERRPPVGPGFSQEHEGWAPVACDSFLLSHSAAGHRAKGVETCGPGVVSRVPVGGGPGGF